MATGRPCSSKRLWVEHCDVMSVSNLRARGFTSFQYGGKRWMPLSITWPDGVRGDLHVELTTTTPYYGGLRYWFVCPSCHRRSGMLYSTGLRVYACRRCHGLVYECQYRKSAQAVWWRFLRKLAAHR
jgi:hypothetical protein